MKCVMIFYFYQKKKKKKKKEREKYKSNEEIIFLMEMIRFWSIQREASNGTC